MARYPLLENRSIRLRSAELFMSSFKLAVQLGFPPNIFITVRYDGGGSRGSPAQQHQRLLERLRKLKRDHPYVCLWVLEFAQPDDTVHAHLMLYFRKYSVNRIRALMDVLFPSAAPGAIKVEGCNDLYGLAAYFLKGGDEGVRRKYLTASQRRNWSPQQGAICHKRIGACHYLTRQVNAQRKALKGNKRTSDTTPSSLSEGAAQ